MFMFPALMFVLMMFGFVFMLGFAFPRAGMKTVTPVYAFPTFRYPAVPRTLFHPAS